MKGTLLCGEVTEEIAALLNGEGVATKTSYGYLTSKDGIGWKITITVEQAHEEYLEFIGVDEEPNAKD